MPDETDELLADEALDREYALLAKVLNERGYLVSADSFRRKPGDVIPLACLNNKLLTHPFVVLSETSYADFHEQSLLGGWLVWPIPETRYWRVVTD